VKDLTTGKTLTNWLIEQAGEVRLVKRARVRSGSWRLLRVFASDVRVEIVELLSQSEMQTLSNIAEKLEKDGFQMSLPGLFKHMRILEEAGIVRMVSGGLVDPPDARKNVYFLEGKERVERILHQLENNVCSLLLAMEMFNTASKLALKLDRVGPRMLTKEREHFESLLEKLESEQVYTLLTDHEKKKVKIWKIMIEG
jgi:DNA-binding transcriptional ArsR family regulator